MPYRDAVDIFNGLSATDRRDTFRALNSAQQMRFVAAVLSRRDNEMWGVILETATAETRVYAVRSLMRAGRLTESQPPWGAYGLLNGLSDSDQAAALKQLSEQERRRLQQELVTARGIDQPRLERSLASIASGTDEAPRQVSFPLTWVAEELPPELGHATPGLGPAAYMGSQGAHAVGPTNMASGMRMVSTGYWRALVPARRAIELQRVLNQLPRDLDSHLATRLSNTPRGQQPSFPWVNRPIGAMQRPFTVAELQSIPELVRRFNTNPSSVSAAEAALLRRAASLHVGGAHQGGSPFVSWSRPSAPGRPDPVTWGDQRRFRVRAEFNPAEVLDNINASRANTLTPAEAAQGFEPPLNPQEAEYLATSRRGARVVTVEPMSGPVRGELVRGSAQWMARHATQLRWAGRGLIVVSFGMSATRIALADPQHRTRVIGQEVGAQALGIGTAILFGAGCVAFSIATGGLGLFLCGLAGGLLGGMAGSALGGATVDAFSDTTPAARNDPFNLMGIQPPAIDDHGQQAVVSPVTGDVLVLPATPPEILVY